MPQEKAPAGSWVYESDKGYTMVHLSILFSKNAFFISGCDLSGPWALGLAQLPLRGGPQVPLHQPLVNLSILFNLCFDYFLTLEGVAKASCFWCCCLVVLGQGHHSFQFDHVFGHTASNKRVYKHAAAEIVQVACEGGIGTIFMFGQTGSGKTHTMPLDCGYSEDC